MDANRLIDKTEEYLIIGIKLAAALLVLGQLGLGIQSLM